MMLGLPLRLFLQNYTIILILYYGINSGTTATTIVAARKNRHHERKLWSYLLRQSPQEKRNGRFCNIVQTLLSIDSIHSHLYTYKLRNHFTLRQRQQRINFVDDDGRLEHDFTYGNEDKFENIGDLSLRHRIAFIPRGGASSRKGKKLDGISKKAAAKMHRSKNHDEYVGDENADTQNPRTIKNKKTKKKLKSMETTSIIDDKQMISNALKEKDSAEALGDAIRNRADQVRSALMSSNSQQQQQQQQSFIHPSIQSVGWAMGTSDNIRGEYSNINSNKNSSSTMYYKEMIFDTNMMMDDSSSSEENSGGVEASPSAVIAHYFLKSHGGAHSLQCICSFLAMTAGLLSLFIQQQSNKNYSTMMILQKRCLTFAMVKHVTGLIAACMMAAKSIPNVGYRQARQWIARLMKDPVSQYVFYTACVLVWLPSRTIVTANATLDRISSSLLSHLLSFTVPVWYTYPLINYCILGPVILREMISTILVLSDVLVLWNTATMGQGTISVIALKLSQNIINAVMCVIISPKKWKSANPSQRQELLAKLTSKCTLFMELMVGGIMILDSLWSIISLLFGSTAMTNSQKQSMVNVIKRIICTRLYVQFLVVRKRKIHELILDIRGGASIVPIHILDILLHPIERMGIETITKKNNGVGEESTNDVIKYNWKNYVQIALDMNE